MANTAGNHLRQSRLRSLARRSLTSLKEKYGSASIVGDNRVIFNIKGNDYRLVVKINYPYRVVYVRFVGTHAEYDAVDVEEV